MGRVARTKAVIYSPPTETELKLQDLQNKFLDPNGCSKADQDEFFLAMRMYARSITLQMIKSKGLVLPPERVDKTTPLEAVFTFDDDSPGVLCEIGDYYSIVFCKLNDDEDS